MKHLLLLILLILLFSACVYRPSKTTIVPKIDGTVNGIDAVIKVSTIEYDSLCLEAIKETNVDSNGNFSISPEFESHTFMPLLPIDYVYFLNVCINNNETINAITSKLSHYGFPYDINIQCTLDTSTTPEKYVCEETR